MTGVSSSQFNCTHTGNTVTCTKASMTVGETGCGRRSRSPCRSTAASGTVVNVGTVEATTPDTNLSNNSDDASVIVVAQAAPTTTLPPVVLPPTGSNSTSPVIRAAFVLVLLGGFVTLISRRRRVRARPADHSKSRWGRLGRGAPTARFGLARGHRPGDGRVCRFVKVFDNRLTRCGLLATERGPCG